MTNVITRRKIIAYQASIASFIFIVLKKLITTKIY
jgi:hypothetical protein